MLNNIRIRRRSVGHQGSSRGRLLRRSYSARAIENFYISNSKISDIPEFVRGMVMVKKAAALANKELQTIPQKRGKCDYRRL